MRITVAFADIIKSDAATEREPERSKGKSSLDLPLGRARAGIFDRKNGQGGRGLRDGCLRLFFFLGLSRALRKFEITVARDPFFSRRRGRAVGGSLVTSMARKQLH